jgi:Fe-Mn family superoxide dismutase
MKFQLPELPYEIDALEPHLTARTLDFHYDRHHRGYLEKLRGLIQGTPQEKMELSDLVTHASGEVFNNAAQVWNHTFYWHSMAPDGGGFPSGRIGQAISKSFGSPATFQKEFIASAVRLFGSGYVWLTFDSERERVAIEPMKDAESPLLVGRVPLLGMDVWEHAYYLDYQNARQRYVEAFLTHLANWRFAEANLSACHSQGAS